MIECFDISSTAAIFTTRRSGVFIIYYSIFHTLP